MVVPAPLLAVLTVLAVLLGVVIGVYMGRGGQGAVPAVADGNSLSSPVPAQRAPEAEPAGPAGAAPAPPAAAVPDPDPSPRAEAVPGPSPAPSAAAVPGPSPARADLVVPVPDIAVIPAGDAADPGDAGRVTPGEASFAAEPSVIPRPALAAAGPRIAVIIDDWGYGWEAADSFLSFPEPLTVAVLPYLPRTAEHARRAREAGFEVILHMPMEAQDAAIDIGPGGVRRSMTDAEIAEAVRAALAAVPGARGLNNHMGSGATTDPRVMRAALGVVAEQGLFFVDSYTVSSTIAYRVAHDLAVPYVVNQVFLDHVDDEEAIRNQLRRLINLALRQGAAVGIGHVRPRTYAALVDMLPEIHAAGIRLVPVSQLLTVPAPRNVAAAAGGLRTGAEPESEEPPQPPAAALPAGDDESSPVR